MRAMVRWGLVVSLVALGVRAAQAQQGKAAPPPMDPKQQAAMEAAQRLSAPGDGHKALEPLVGTWTYTAQWWMAPEAPAETMTGTAVNSLVFGGRFLKQEFHGEAAMEGQPPFEGLGYTGYDNIRNEYQSVWLDNMATGMMVGAGRFDAAAKTLTDQGEFSCPLTMETHRKFRSLWKVDDQNHTTYLSYMSTPDGKEYKAMEIRYTRQAPNAPGP